MKVCMLAAENDALPGAKVGGIGDVIRDLPNALVSAGVEVSVVLPSYNSLHHLDGMQQLAEFSVLFRGNPETIALYRQSSDPPNSDTGLTQYLVHHPLFGACGAGKVYCNDADGQPFASDASKFALYCVAALTAVREGFLGDVNVLHLHDWHAAMAVVLKTFHPEFAALQSLRCVFSIHNLALQGIRPFTEQASSLQAWFPELDYELSALADPRWPHCINPMAAGIRLADVVSTVSPGYADEIVQANDKLRGFHGGEGLESDLRDRAKEGKLVGIINGIDYPESTAVRQEWVEWCTRLSESCLREIATDDVLRGVDYVAHQRLQKLQQQTAPQHLLTSVGRMTTQKSALFFTNGKKGQSALDAILERLEGNGIFIMLGSGDRAFEKACQLLAAKHEHFIFINRYADELAELLYTQGDVFLMPSSFEPCGISQMLAMRAAQPCIVHAVGGLGDTVEDDVDGFCFSAESTTAQSDAFVSRVNDVIRLREHDAGTFSAICDKASAKRFKWDGSARRYVSELYQ